MRARWGRRPRRGDHGHLLGASLRLKGGIAAAGPTSEWAAARPPARLPRGRPSSSSWPAARWRRRCQQESSAGCKSRETGALDGWLAGREENGRAFSQSEHKSEQSFLACWLAGWPNKLDAARRRLPTRLRLAFFFHALLFTSAWSPIRAQFGAASSRPKQIESYLLDVRARLCVPLALALARSPASLRSSRAA